MNKIIYIVTYLLSRSPVFSTTLDKQFHDISRNNFTFNDLRFSLFSLGLGIRKIYIFSWKYNEKFSFIKVLNLNDINKLPREQEIQNKLDLYHEFINNKDKSDIQCEIDFLKYKIDQDENTKNLTKSKANNYTAVVLVLIPLILTIMPNITNKLNNTLKIIFWIIIIYNSINVVIYLLDFYKVRSFNRSTFADIKQSDKHLNKLAESYYEDWYSIKSESSFFVTYVTNVERYFKYCILFLIVTFCLNGIVGVYTNIKIVKVNNKINANNVYSFRFNNNGEIYKQDSDQLINVYNKIKEGKLKQVIVVRNVSDNDSSDKKYELILNSIKMFNSSHVDIEEINDTNNIDVKSNYIKIIIRGVK